MTYRSLLWWLVLAVLGLSLTACGGATTTTVTSAPVTLPPTTVTTLPVTTTTNSDAALLFLGKVDVLGDALNKLQAAVATSISDKGTGGTNFAAYRQGVTLLEKEIIALEVPADLSAASTIKDLLLTTIDEMKQEVSAYTTGLKETEPLTMIKDFNDGLNHHEQAKVTLIKALQLGVASKGSDSSTSMTAPGTTASTAAVPQVSSTSVATLPSTPSAQTSTEGEEGSLSMGEAEVWLPVDGRANDELTKASVARDAEGVQALISSGRVLVVPDGTRVRVLEHGILTYRVRVLEGANSGAIGVIAREFVK